MLTLIYAYIVTGGMTFTFGGIKIIAKAEVLCSVGSTKNLPVLVADDMARFFILA